MGNEQNINLFFDRFDKEFQSNIPKVVAETATEFFKERFKTQEWEGSPWPALNPRYAARKTHGKGRILTEYGTLMNSIHPRYIVASKVIISSGNSKVPYARVHNEGLRVSGIRSVKGYVNKNFMGRGKPVKIGPHLRTVNFQMKKRQFMGNSPILNQTIRKRLIDAWNAR